MARAKSLDVFAGNPVNGGTPVGSFAGWYNLRVAFDLNWTAEQLSFSYTRPEEVDNYFHEGMFIRRQVTSISSVVGADTTTHWLVRRITRETDGGTVSVECDPMAVLLKDIRVRELDSGTGFINTTIGFSDATPEEIVDGMIAALSPALPSWIAKGTIDSTDRLDFSTTNVSLAAWCEKFAEAIGAEFRFRFDSGAGKYKLDFVTQIGAGAAPFVVATGKNLAALQLSQDYEQAATTAFPQDGEGRGIEHTEWEVTNVASDVLTLKDPLDRDIDPVPFDDCLNSHYAAKDQASYDDEQITDSAAPNLITVVDDTDYTTGDIIVLRRGTGSTGERMTLLSNPGPTVVDPTTFDANYEPRMVDVPRPEVVATRNLVKNGFMREYTNASAAPDGWTFTNASGTGATVTRSTNNTLYGGFSARMQGTAASVIHVLATPIIWHWEVGPDGLAMVRVRLHVQTLANANLVRVEVNASATTSSVGTQFTAITTTGTQNILIPNMDPSALTSGYYVRVYVARTGGGAIGASDIYVDVAQVTPGGSDPQAYIEGSNCNVLYGMAAQALAARNPSARNFNISFADLARLASPNPWSDDMVTLGGLVELESDELDIDEQIRVVRYVLNDDDVLQSEVLLQGRKERLLELLARQQAAVSNDQARSFTSMLAKEIERGSDGDTGIAYTGTTAALDTFTMTNQDVGKLLVAPRVRSALNRLTT